MSDDKSQLTISIDMKVSDRQYQVVENSVTSILFQLTDTATRYVYNIRMREMKKQSETTTTGLSSLDLKKECNIPVDIRTDADQVFRLSEKYQGNIMLVEFFKYEGIPVLCAQCVLIVKPANLKIAQVFFKDWANKEVGCGSVQYEANLKFALRVKYNRPLLRGEKAPKLKCKGYCTNAVTGEYEEISKFRVDENGAYTDTFYCDDGLQESHAGADYVFSFGINNPYGPPFMIEDTNALAPSIQKIHLIGRNLKKPQITSVVWSSKEMIKFGEDSPQRKGIYRNEDGFLHIHTRGMYGQKVRVELFEKDTTGIKKLLLGLKDDVTILDNVVCVPVEMSGVYAKAAKGRHALAEGLSFEILAKITPLDTSIAAFEQDDKSLIELQIYGKADEDKAAKSTVNGTMKFVIADVEEDEREEKKGKDCGGKYCITKSNYKEKNVGKLIQEINIRLAGFGGNVPTEEFTDKTEACIKQFQKDYMEVTETGKICGSLLKAIDEFCKNTKYDFNFEQTKCPCGKCKGYGNAKTSGEVRLYKNKILQPKATYLGNEYPGMHRSVLFGVRALLFYLEKNAKLGYSFTEIGSGYRCWESNAIKHRSSKNHMGKAIDLHFNKSTLADIEAIRDKVLIPNLNAQIRWGAKNKFSLEPSRRLPSKPKEFIAESWIHIDVREFEENYLSNKFFVKSESDMRGQKLTDIAQNLGLTDLCTCIIASKKRTAAVQEDEEICDVCSKTKSECKKRFNKLSKIILQHEGGYCDRKEDKGGKTNKGISWSTWQAYAKIDLEVEPTVENLKALTDEQAEIIYYKRYWQPKKFCKIEDIKVALMIYDWTITSSGASKQVQKLLVNEYGKAITIDGQIGNKTIEAINTIENQTELLNKIGKKRKEYYKNLTIDKKTGKENDQIKNLKGWENRVNDCLNQNIN